MVKKVGMEPVPARGPLTGGATLPYELWELCSPVHYLIMVVLSFINMFFMKFSCHFFLFFYFYNGC